MEMILELTNPGVISHKLWKNIVAGGILLIFLASLYLSAFNQSEIYSDTKYHENTYSKELMDMGISGCMPYGRNVDPGILSTAGMSMPELSLNIKSRVDIQSVPVIVTDVSENNKVTEEQHISEITADVDKEDTAEESEGMMLTVKVYGNGGTPVVSESSCTWDTFSIGDIAEPYRAGKLFDGWYLDEECTKPAAEMERTGTTISLYAGWAEFPGFTANDSGYLTSCTDASLILMDGFLVLPSYKSCIGVEKHAFEGIEDAVMELYIPDNIRYIAPGAFDGMSQLLFIEVSPDNPNYYGEDGILYNRDGSVAVYPKGRE